MQRYSLIVRLYFLLYCDGLCPGFIDALIPSEYPWPLFLFYSICKYWVMYIFKSLEMFSNDDVEAAVIFIFLKYLIYISKRWKIRKARPGRVFYLDFTCFLTYRKLCIMMTIVSIVLHCARQINVLSIYLSITICSCVVFCQ